MLGNCPRLEVSAHVKCKSLQAAMTVHRETWILKIPRPASHSSATEASATARDYSELCKKPLQRDRRGHPQSLNKLIAPFTRNINDRPKSITLDSSEVPFRCSRQAAIPAFRWLSSGRPGASPLRLVGNTSERPAFSRESSWARLRFWLHILAVVVFLVATESQRSWRWWRWSVAVAAAAVRAVAEANANAAGAGAGGPAAAAAAAAGITSNSSSSSSSSNSRSRNRSRRSRSGSGSGSRSRRSRRRSRRRSSGSSI